MAFFDSGYNLLKMVEQLQELTGSKLSNDIVTIKIKTAHSNIKNYLNNDEIDMYDSNGIAKYETEVLLLAEYMLNNSSNRGLSQETQGERSKTYQNNGELPTFIIGMLPLPRLRVI